MQRNEGADRHMAQYSTCQFFIILTQCAMMIIRYQLSVTHSRLSLRLFYLSAHRWRSIFISDAAFMFFSNSFCWKAPIQGPSRPQSREQRRKIKKKPWEVFFQFVKSSISFPVAFLPFIFWSKCFIFISHSSFTLDYFLFRFPQTWVNDRA